MRYFSFKYMLHRLSKIYLIPTHIVSAMEDSMLKSRIS